MREEQINEAYRLAAECAGEYEGMIDARHALYLAMEESSSEAGNVKRATDALADAHRMLSGTTVQCRSALEPLQEVLDALSDGPVDWLFRSEGSSFLEALVVMSEEAVERTRPALEPPARGESSERAIRATAGTTDDELFSARRLLVRLRIEAAHVRRYVFGDAGVKPGEEALWQRVDGRVQLIGRLAELADQSRKLMIYFIRKQGTDVRYHDIAEDVMYDDMTREGTIQQAISTLRKLLVGFGLNDLAERIRPLGGGVGYRFS